MNTGRLNKGQPDEAKLPLGKSCIPVKGERILQMDVA